MSDTPRTLLLCSCEDSIPLRPGAAVAPSGALASDGRVGGEIDLRRVAAGCGAHVETGRHLCRSEIARVLAAVGTATGTGTPLTIACTQEAETFIAAIEEAGLPAGALSFVDVRETAGWSSDGAAAAPKIAALVAAAAVPVPPGTAVTFQSEGVTLILGRDQGALEAARQLADRLDVTVLLQPGADVAPPRIADIPIRFGRVRNARGHLGAFELTIDGYAEPLASSRARLVAGPSRNGAVSTCDVVIDLTGGPPLFPGASPGHDLRQGYLRADPGDPAAVQRALFRASDLTGTFDIPRYVAFHADLCAHARSRITGCTRCLEVCPAGAITPAGNTVAIDPHICGGCGQCTAVCPTGAAQADGPPPDVTIARLRAAITAYRRADASARAPHILLHDREHGADLVSALARFGAGFPAHVVPLEVREVTGLGLEAIVSALAYGAAGIAVLTRARPRHDITSLVRLLDTADTLAAALGYGPGVVQGLATDDPDQLLALLQAAPSAVASPRPAGFLPLGGKRDLLRLSLRELHRAAPAPVERVPMPAGSAFGAVHVDAAGCTLCLACVSACPPRALTANPDRPELKFDESLCVQCGLCQATCPEKVITLEPRVDFAAFEAGPRTLKEEEPFCCTRCGTAFGVRSTLERVRAKLAGSHWMFSGENDRRLEVLSLCDTCRIEAMTTDQLDPYAGPARPKPRTAEDYYREREEAAAREAEVAAREAAMLGRIDKGEV